MTEDSLAAVGLSGRKIEYVKSIAETFERVALTREAFETLTDEQVIDRLVENRGVGAWTAKIFLMFALGRPTCFPSRTSASAKECASCWPARDDPA